MITHEIFLRDHNIKSSFCISLINYDARSNSEVNLNFESKSLILAIYLFFPFYMLRFFK